MPLAKWYKCQYAAELLKTSNKLFEAQTNLQEVFENIDQILIQLLFPNSALVKNLLTPQTTIMTLLESDLSNGTVPETCGPRWARTFKVKIHTLNLPGASRTDSRPQGLRC